MEWLQRILVPVDFSEASLAALDCAAMLGERFGAEVDVLHVWPPPEDADRKVDLLAEFAVSEEGRKMRECLARFDPHSAVEAKGRLASGEHRDVPATIVDVAEGAPYDLIVMATHGHMHFLRSSVTQKVVRNSRCPVLTVRVEDPSADWTWS
jgi:universal stress protein A